MMSNLADGLKQHAVTLYEVGKSPTPLMASDGLCWPLFASDCLYLPLIASDCL